MWPSASFCPAAAPARGEAAGVGNGEDVADQEGAQGGAAAVQAQNGGASLVSTALLKGKRGEDQRAAPGFSVQIYSGELIELSRTVRGLICSTASCRPSWLSDISRIK